ncbi:MAG TPA: hypothetical protein VLW50_05830 [Streptosporangiaceae bacterium]|nr:hypothetical protein [Streptosporangiaceae bacterium]
MSPDVPGQAASSDCLIEIRPVRPAGKLLPREPWTLGNWRLTADTGSGTLTLSGDKFPGGRGSRVFQLPATGRADAVTTVCLATHHWEIRPRSGTTWRMLLLDREGRLVRAGIPRDYPQVLRLFPPEVFEPLAAVGIRVIREGYDSTRALEDAHPGAAGKVALIGASRGRTAAIGLTTALLILIVIFITVYLTR